MGTGLQPGETGNAILDRLSSAQLERIEPHLSLRTFAAGAVVRTRAGNGRTVQFPRSGVVADFVEDASGSSVAATLAGAEGVIGLPLWLGAPQSSSEWVWLIAGEAWRLPLGEASDELSDAIHRFAAVQLHELRLTTACHLLHAVEARLARFLLEITERTGADELAMTHERLAAMVGVTRPRITAALEQLERSRGIHRGRGRILIWDPERLSRMPCDCYPSIRAMHAAVGLPWPVHRSAGSGPR